MMQALPSRLYMAWLYRLPGSQSHLAQEDSLRVLQGCQEGYTRQIPLGIRAHGIPQINSCLESWVGRSRPLAAERSCAVLRRRTRRRSAIFFCVRRRHRCGRVQLATERTNWCERCGGDAHNRMNCGTESCGLPKDFHARDGHAAATVLGGCVSATWQRLPASFAIIGRPQPVRLRPSACPRW